jgi:hypothetical protein
MSIIMVINGDSYGLYASKWNQCIASLKLRARFLSVSRCHDTILCLDDASLSVTSGRLVVFSAYIALLHH